MPLKLYRSGVGVAPGGVGDCVLLLRMLIAKKNSKNLTGHGTVYLVPIPEVDVGEVGEP